MALRERADPLRRRVLEALAEEPAITGVLAERLGVAPETMSRQLTALRTGGLVKARAVLGDARKHEYVLTSEGEIELSQHRAFGAPEPPPVDLTEVQVLRFLTSALENAVKMRRRVNKLDDAAARLLVALEQARKADAQELVVDVLAELATTLRQAHKEAELDGVLASLDRIALGHESRMGAAVALPAAAHREYALGRRVGDERDSAARAEHLISAFTLYKQLSETPTCGTPKGWKTRQAWSAVSLANNLRASSQFEAALWWSGQALGMFDELEDHYGRSRCLFMFGFCLRLLGDFDGAWEYLDRAHEIAAEHTYERFQADTLMQMGEVRRCQGETDEAGEMLDEALQRAANMQAIVVQAFARSARGAVECQRYRFKDAEQQFLKAHSLFASCGNQEGIALNVRRRATVARRALDQHGDRHSVYQLIAEALALYTNLQSPAGITACEIEDGRLRLKRNGNVGQIVQKLTDRLDDPAQRDLLEHDPWVPQVLCQFARETGNEDSGLTERATRLLAAAQSRAQEIGRTLGRTIRQVTRNQHTASIIDEMGGETRRRHDAAETPQPVCF